MHATIRSATLSGYLELARSVGLDPNRQMRKCGLDPSCLSDPDARIDATAVAKLLETSAAESRVEDFGLRLSKARRLSNLGPFSLVVREETTARRALETRGPGTMSTRRITTLPASSMRMESSSLCNCK